MKEMTNNSNVYYYKGLLEIKESKKLLIHSINWNIENNAEAVLFFEQAIQNNNNKSAVTKSLFEIAKILIIELDFYSAHYTLNRQEFYDVDKEYLSVL